MNEDIQKAVDAGKITPRAGAALEKLTPGSWCLHKSWGFGRITEVSFLINQVTIDFKARKGHSMQLEYAAESLQPISDDHVLAQKAENLGAVKTRAKDDPVGLVRQILENQGGRATQDQIGAMLLGDVFTEAELKRWWEATKKLLKKDALISVPAKKTAPYELRGEALSRGNELLAEFLAARQIKPLIAAADQIARSLDNFEQPAAQLEPVVRGLEDAARKNQRLHTPQAFELVLARDEICAKVEGLEPEAEALTITRLLKEEDRRLDDIIGNIPAAKLKRVFAELPAAFGEQWVTRALRLMERGNTRAAADLSVLLVAQGKHEELRRELDRWIREHSISSDILCWLCKERDGDFGELIEPRVFTAILSALERDQVSDETRRSYKLRDLVLDDRELVSDLLAGADAGEARDAMRRLLMTPVFEDLNKRSMLGRVIRVHPELQAMVSGESAERQEALIVSWETLEKRKADYEELITKKIPENTKEISIARSYGDLRENFEFKAAKEMQRVLMRRKADWEAALSNARGTGFENPDTGQVSIGTVVTVRKAAGGDSTYIILGAWDSEPASGIISYQTAMGQALLGHKVGEQVELPTEVGTERVEITGIRAWREAAAS